MPVAHPSAPATFSGRNQAANTKSTLHLVWEGIEAAKAAADKPENIGVDSALGNLETACDAARAVLAAVS